MSDYHYLSSIVDLAKIIVEFQWLEQLLNHANMFETGVVRANAC